MIDKTDYIKNTQKAVNDGMETFLNLGNSAIDNSFSIYEQVIGEWLSPTSKTEVIQSYADIETYIRHCHHIPFP